MVLEFGEAPKPKGMQCPHCHVPLVMSSRQNIEIDYCPECRGIWLDRGELDKIVERSMEQSAPQNESRSQARHRKDDDDDYKYKKRYKKKSWIAEIFDELT